MFEIHKLNVESKMDYLYVVGINSPVNLKFREERFYKMQNQF